VSARLTDAELADLRQDAVAEDLRDTRAALRGLKTGECWCPPEWQRDQRLLEAFEEKEGQSIRTSTRQPASPRRRCCRRRGDGRLQ
jgi:hypothetical protein